jgi:hypothetical protein
MTVANTIKLQITILELYFMILALAIIDDTRIVIYATIWRVIYDRKFMILDLL